MLVANNASKMLTTLSEFICAKTIKRVSFKSKHKDSAFWNETFFWFLNENIYPPLSPQIDEISAKSF